ncbi:MAG: phage baseplate assembly protein V [Muribaculaceae bacterium]|nr:phage baseplate assembly protein V [Muribaculaceae bacterium]
MSTTVSRFALTIDDARSEDFLIEIDGELFKLDNFVLTQCLMQPNTLRFRMLKGPKEDGSEPQFKTCGSIIGKDITLSLETENFEKLSSFNIEGEKTEEIKFKGIITSINGSRSMSEYSLDIEAKSYDALLIDNPTCKSFENKTLNDIVEDVVDDYSDLIDAKIDARFTEAIPYTVQYNETNYQFLLRLAQRFGEWIYNDGEHLIFGNLPQGQPVTLGYPDKDITAYNVNLKIQHTAFSHIASSYNLNDSTAKEGAEEMEREYNNLADLVFNIARDRSIKPTLQYLRSGGFADKDGRTTVLNVSTKTQARGEKANMLVYSGSTYCSKLKIGNTLIIQDNFLSNDLVGNISEVVQDEILITELVHFFSADETYSNSFVGIPAACDYPPYSDSDVFPAATSSRAKVTNTEDPNHLGRVRVQFDWQAQLGANSDGEEMMTPWLRVSQPYAGGGKGFSFIPEIGEEVMIDFEGGNAERPYVKGTLYNGVEDPDSKWLPGDNQVKAIRTRNGHTIEIWDEGEGGYIRIYDNEKENYILTFSTDEKLIKLESTGNIELYAQNDIIMHAGHDINASADNDVFIAAGHDMQRTADNDIREHAGNDRSTSIERNDSLTVSQNQFIRVEENKNEEVTHKLQITAENIRTEAKEKLLEYSSTHHMKASQDLAVNASNRIDIKASQVKTN